MSHSILTLTPDWKVCHVQLISLEGVERGFD